MKKKKNKSYIEGYDFAMRYGTNALTKKEEIFFQDGGDFAFYNSKTKSKEVKFFDEGKIDAEEFMNSENKMLRKAIEELSFSCYDGYMEDDWKIRKLLKYAENYKEMKKLVEKFSEGVDALMDFYKKTIIKEEYDI